MSKVKATFAVTALVVALAAIMLPAQAATGGKVTTGTCSGTSTWMLTLKYDAGRVESDVEVQTSVAGHPWRSTFKDNMVVFGHALKTTAGDGSFSATRYAPNQVGTDAILVRAKNLTTGEVCRATGSL